MSVTRSRKSLVVAMVALAASGVLVTSCSSDSATGTVASLLSDSTATLDVATTSGDALATSVETMAANEAATLSFDVLRSVSASNAFTVSRSKTCYDGSGAVVAACSPLTSVRKIVSLVKLDGTRGSSNTVTGGTSTTWSGAIHRVSNDTTVRNFSTAATPAEISRTHSDVIVGHDTTMFSDATTTRNHVETTHDTVKGVTWNMPRSSNPFPISGSIVRVDSVHVTVTKATQTETKDRVHVVEVDFPADAQGNVTLKVDAKTCSLNLVTHAISGCK